MPVTVGVIGSGDPSARASREAYEVGRLIAERGARLVCGGLSGVMEAACRGAAEAGGLTIGILPGSERGGANPWVGFALPTGMGIGRNVLVVRAADVLIALPGGNGTLSEVALALNLGKPVVDLGGWGREGVIPASGPAEAVEIALSRASKTCGGTEKAGGNTKR